MHRVLILGAGKIGALVSGLLAESGSYRVHLGDVDGAAAEAVVRAHGGGNLTSFPLDASNATALAAHLAAHPVDAVISSLPYHCNVAVAEAARKARCHYFDLTEDGAVRPVTAFSDASSPISLAIVAQSIPAEVTALRRSGDEIIQAQSVAEGLRALATSKNSRKALIFTSGTIVGEIPSEIQVLKAGPQSLMKSVIEVMNSYSLQFSSSSPASAVEVSLRPVVGLPPLTVKLSVRNEL